MSDGLTKFLARFATYNAERQLEDEPARRAPMSLFANGELSSPIHHSVEVIR